MSKEKGFATIINKLPDKRRFRFFFFFVFISFIFWMSTKLSKEYQVAQSFDVEWSNIPKDILLDKKAVPIYLTIEASGIEILWYRLFKNRLQLSLDKVDFDSDTVFLSTNDQYIAIQQQLFNSSKLSQISPSNLPILFSRLSSKKIAVRANTDVKLRPGFLGEHDMEVLPDSVLVFGSQSILDTITSIPTILFRFSDLHQALEEELDLMPISGLQYEQKRVKLQWTVLRYSEKQLDIPIEVINLPQGVRVRLFPPAVKVTATLPLDKINTVLPSDFKMVVDYHEIIKTQASSLELLLLEQPSLVKKLTWEPKTVNYLIRK